MIIPIWVGELLLSTLDIMVPVCVYVCMCSVVSDSLQAHGL